MKRPRKEPVLAGQTLQRWVKRNQFEGNLRQGQLALAWREIVGERIAARSQPRSMRAGELTVNVVDNAWMTELSFLRPQLIDAINARLGGEPSVQSLRLVLGPISGVPPEPPPREVLPAPRRVPLSEPNLPRLKDSELRALIARAIEAQGRDTPPGK